MKPISIILIFICSLCFHDSFAQITFNGDLEKIDPKTKLPAGWHSTGRSENYQFKVDSTIKQQGRYALSIESDSKTETSDGTSYAYVLPYTFSGRQLQLKAFVKTENIVGRFAGLILQIGGKTTVDHLKTQNVTGTTDWREYTLTLPYDEEAANISVGILLAGKGKMWLDNVRLYLDGQPIENAPTKKIALAQAQQDMSFSSSSGISNILINDRQVKNLTLLCQVWGFVKYHHPAVAKGDFNMDAELFRVMPSVIKAQNDKEASDAIEHWIDKLGVPERCNNCEPYTGKNIALKPDYGEIFDKQVVSPSLAGKLTDILNNRAQGKSYYVELRGQIGNPIFKNELAYEYMGYPDAGFRMLSLFRYWNMIQYFYPYKYLIGQDWKTILTAFIPQFANAKNATEYDLAVMKLTSSIHDSHAIITNIVKELEDYRGQYAPPFQAKFVEDKLVVTAHYYAALDVKDKVQIGDIITSINGVAVPVLIKKYLPLTSGSNYSRQLHDMPRNYLLRANDPQFEFGIIRNGKPIKVSLRGVEHTKLNFQSINNLDLISYGGYYLIDNQIGYLYAAKYFNKDLPAIKKLFNSTKGIIIDMRCYPSEPMPFTFVPYIKTGDAAFVKFVHGDVSNPGFFDATEPVKIKSESEYKGKVVVIVNEETISQAEYTTMAFQSSPNVTVIGSTTAGADGDVSPITLPGGINTVISGLGILYPDGKVTQRKGVKIDEEIHPTIAGIKAGRDELLERAKAIILKN